MGVKFENTEASGVMKTLEGAIQRQLEKLAEIEKKDHSLKSKFKSVFFSHGKPSQVAQMRDVLENAQRELRNLEKGVTASSISGGEVRSGELKVDVLDLNKAVGKIASTMIAKIDKAGLESKSHGALKSLTSEVKANAGEVRKFGEIAKSQMDSREQRKLGR